MFLRFIFYSVLFYFIIKIIRSVFRYMSSPEPEKKEVKINTASNPNKFNIKKEDIIDAEFEELKDSDTQK